MTILNNEQKDIKKLVRDIVEKNIAPRAAEYDKSKKFPWDNIRDMGQLGIMGMPVEEEYEGAGLDTLSYIIALEEVAKGCASTGIILAVHTSAATMPIVNFGTQQQKEKYVPDLASGRKVGAFAITEPDAGSDAKALTTTALATGDGYILNGTKCFITNGGAAETFIVFASTDKSKDIAGISAFIVEKNSPGFSIGKEEDKMGICASSTVQIILEDCLIPKENLLGKEGEGFKIAMETLDGGRISVAAQAIGIAQAAFDAAVKYSKERIQFDKPIAQQQAMGFMLADMAITIEAARNLIYHAAMLKDAAKPFSKEAAMAKVFASDTAVKVTCDAIQVLGGYGYSREYPVERMMRDAKVTQIYEGTNQIQRIVIARHILKGSN